MSDLATVTVATLPQAIKRIAAKTPVGSPLRTADWAGVPLALRERAQLTAGVEDLRIVQGLGDKLKEWAEFTKRDPQRAFMGRQKFVLEMKSMMGSPSAEDTGSLTDIASRRRLELIYNFQTTDAAEFTRHVVGQNAGVLDAFPCQELVRVQQRKEPRDWLSRWTGAGGQLFDGRMIARKDDDIWVAISRFGKPWPPFDFGSGMGLADVGRDESISLGVISADDTVEPTLDDFNVGLEASVTDLDAEKQRQLKSWFGDQIAIKDGVASWVGNS